MVGLVTADMRICAAPGAGPYGLGPKHICIARLVAVHTQLHCHVIRVILWQGSHCSQLST